MNTRKEVKSAVPERVSVSCPTCGTRHNLQFTYQDTEIIITVVFCQLLFFYGTDE